MNDNPLPEVIIAMLRGEAVYSAEWEDLAKLSQEFYQEGRAGRPYDLLPTPEGLFHADVVEVMGNFLRRCWEQGRREVTGNENQT